MMIRNLCNKVAVIFYYILLASGLHAQSGYTYTAGLQKVGVPGFYTIEVSPDIAAKANANLSDLRILDPSGQQVPFFFRHEITVKKQPVWIDFLITNAGFGADKLYHYVLHNSTKRELDHLLLNFQNTHASRFITISGSDDEKQWFAIRENISIDVSPGTTRTSFFQKVDLPVSNYAYFRITILGKDLIPVKLLKAGNSEAGQMMAKWKLLPAPVITRKDSTDKHSYFLLAFSDHYSIDKLVLQFAGTPFFQRQVEIFTSDKFNSPLVEATIQSNLPLEIAVEKQAKYIWVVVDNKDNPPLELENAKVYMLRKDIVAYLKAGQNYQLSFGDTALTTMPSYDIGLFKDSIPDSLPVVLTASIRKTQPENVNVQKDKGNTVTWFALGFVLVVLLLITMRMTKEVNKSKKTGS